MLMNSQYGFSSNLQQMEFPFEDYPICDDVNGSGVLDPGEMTNIDNMPGETTWEDNFSMWIVDYVGGDVWAMCTWEYYTDDHDHIWRLFGVTDFVIDGTRIFTDDHGNGVEIQVYWLENQKIWYNDLCSDPWSTEPDDYQLFFDAYQAGWDEIQGNACVYQPPGTGLWPPSGLNLWSTLSGNNITVGNGFLDCNDGHSGYEYYQDVTGTYFPEQYDLDRDKGKTNDCRDTSCTIQEDCQDQYDIEDPVVLHGAGPIVVEINICLCEKICAPRGHAWSIPGPSHGGSAYFTVEVSDVTLCDKDGIDYNTIMEEVQTTDYYEISPADIDRTGLVVLDTDINFTAWKAACSHNVILIGGPVANSIVNQLVNEGISTVDWATSPGEWEYIAAPYGDCHILIVAGADREATQTAVQALIDCL
jgi:hypothetical protein